MPGRPARWSGDAVGGAGGPGDRGAPVRAGGRTRRADRWVSPAHGPSAWIRARVRAGHGTGRSGMDTAVSPDVRRHGRMR
ncbi:hypothetical protein GCM10027091_22460 [Streptomyces daliensis]